MWIVTTVVNVSTNDVASGLLARGDRHHYRLITGVRDRDEDLADSEHLRPLGRSAGQNHAGASSARDLDVGPPQMPPARAETLHHRFLAGESSGQARRRVAKPRGVLPLVLGEAAPTERRAVAIE